MGTVEEPTALAQRIADQVRELLRGYGAAIYLEDANGDMAAVATSGELGPTFRPGLVLPRGSGSVGLVLREGRALTSPNLLTDPRVTLSPETRQLVAQTEIRAVLAVPLATQGTVIGAVWVGAGEGRVFTGTELAIAQAFADQAAAAIENARLYRESEVHQRRLATMVEVARKLTSQLDLPAMLETVAAAAAEMFGANVGFRLIEGDDLVLRGATPGAREKMVKERLKIGESISGRVAATGEPIVTIDVPADPRVIPEHRRRGSGTDMLMCVPIRGGSRILGTLSIYRERGQRFHDADLALARSLADQTGVALENAHLYQRSVQQAERMNALADVTRLLSETLEVDLVAARIADSIRALLSVHHAVIFRLEPEAAVLVSLAATEDLARALGQEIRFPVGIGAVGRAVQDRGLVASPNALTDSRIVLTPDLRRQLEEAPWRAVLAVPLVIGDRVIGAVGVGDREGRVFDEEDVRLAETFAAQAAIALENAKLYRDSRQAYADLAHAQEQLLESQRMEAVGRLAGGIAHEFNNILTVILGRASALLEQHLAPTDPSRRDIDAIHRMADRAATLTRQLLAFGRRQVLRPRVVDINTIVNSTHGMLRRLIGEDIELEMALRPDVWQVMADPGQIEQVLANLAVNAREAMPTGGRLRIETDNAFVDEGVLEDAPSASIGDHVFLRVSDSGVGIDPAIRPRIFEPFFTTKGPAEGSGLGLSTVDGIVKQHRGFVTVLSVLGEGTVVTVYLPRHKQASDVPVAHDRTRDAPPRTRKTILLVEDEEEVRNVARDILEDAGFTVLAGDNARAGLQLCRQHGGIIDLVLTDVVMPGMSGPELVKEVRRLRGQTRYLYMSGYSADRSDRREFLDIETAIVAKPFTPEALTTAVCRVLEGN